MVVTSSLVGTSLEYTFESTQLYYPVIYLFLTTKRAEISSCNDPSFIQSSSKESFLSQVPSIVCGGKRYERTENTPPFSFPAPVASAKRIDQLANPLQS